MNDAFIIDAIRTPFGRYGGALSSIRTDDLAALPLKALMEQAGLCGVEIFNLASGAVAVHRGSRI